MTVALPPPWPMPARSGDAERDAALAFVTEAWIEGIRMGLDPDPLAEAALRMALRELVALRGEASVAGLLAEIGPQIAMGLLSPSATRQ